MRSNDVLKKEVRQLRKEGSDNYRVKQIKNLRQQLRETQAISDALTRTLMDKAQMSADEVGELYDDILSQPKLAKPNNPVKLKKDVLVLQNSTTALERELAATKKLLREYRSGERRMDADGEVVRSAKAAAAPSDSALAEELRQLRLAHAVALGEVETKGRVAALHRDMCAKLQQENRELKTMKLQWDGLAAAKEAAEQDAAHTRQQMIQSMGSTEEYHQDIRELRTKLATLLSVRDKVEQQHAEKVGDLRTSIGKIQERELQLRGHIQLLKADLKAAQDAVSYYKQSAALAKTQAAASLRATESDRVCELQNKLAIVSKDLKEKSTELRAAQAILKGGRHGSSEAEHALQDRVSQLKQDNAQLRSQLDAVERRYITHHEELSRGVGERSALEVKYTALLREMDERATRFQSNQQLMLEMETRLHSAENAAQQQAAQLADAHAQRDAERQRTEQLEGTIKQLKLALDERARFDGGGAGAGAGGGANTSRSDLSDSADDLLSNRPSGSESAKSLAAKLRRVEETHLEHVAKLMRNFEIKEKEHLYQIAKLQETIRPGSGNRTHLTYKDPYNTRIPPQSQQQQQAAKKPFNIDTSSSESDDDDDDDDLSL